MPSSASSSRDSHESHLWDSKTFQLDQHWPRPSVGPRDFPLSHQPLRLFYEFFYIVTFPLRFIFQFLPTTVYQRLFDQNAPKGQRWLDTLSVLIGRSLIDDLWIRTGGGMRGYHLPPSLTESQLRKHLSKTSAMPQVYQPSLKVEQLRQPVRLWADNAGARIANHLTIWWLGARREQINQSPAAKGEKVVLYLCGGGYHVGTCYPAHDLGSISRSLVEEIQRTSSTAPSLPQSVVAVEYRKTGAAPTPAALLDALSVFYHLTKDLGFEAGNISVVGDSAGGHLTNALVRYLLEGGEATPSKIVLISPWGDQAGTIIEHPSSSYRQNMAYDYLSDHFVHYCRDVFACRLDNPMQDLLDVYFSPCAVLGKVKTRQSTSSSSSSSSPTLRQKEVLVTKETEKDIFKNWPATLILWGSYEILKDQSLEMLRRLKMSKEAEGKLGERHLCGYTMNTCHDPFILPFFALARERRMAIEKIVAWLALE